jgi:hypothetical protein
MTRVPVTPAPQPGGHAADEPPGQPQGQPAGGPGSGLAQAARGRPAFPGAPPSAPCYEDEIRAAVSYEKGLAIKALLALAIVGAVLVVRIFFLG